MVRRNSKLKCAFRPCRRVVTKIISMITFVLIIWILKLEKVDLLYVQSPALKVILGP